MEQVVPEVTAADKIQNPDAKAMALTGDTRQDMANIAKELGIPLDAQGNVAETQTAQPAPVTPSPVPEPVAAKSEPKPVEVPPKFQNPDGTVNEAKLEKSTKSLEEGIAYFKAKEREFQQLQNKVNNPPPSAQQNVPAPVPQQLSPLEYQMAQDLINEAAAQGVQLDQRLAVAQARVMAKGLEAKHRAELSVTEDIRRELGETRMTNELSDLMKADKSLLTPEVADRVLAIKQERGFKTYREAYIHHLGEQMFRQHTQQVPTPNPTGPTAQVPPAPVSPVARVQPTVDLTDRRSLEGMDLKDLEALAAKTFPGYRGGPRY